MYRALIDNIVRVLTIISLVFSSILPAATVSAQPAGQAQALANPWPEPGGGSAAQSAVASSHALAAKGVLDDSLPRSTNFSIEADPLARVTADLQVLYLFEEGSGTTVGDDSGVGSPLDLTIADENAASWGTNYLAIDSSTIASSGVAATKVIDAAKASHEITIEAWVKPANPTQSGPARIVSVSADTSNRNFTL
jgi:hypothetical protein